MESLVSSGLLSEQTMVWTEGMDEWEPLHACRHLFDFDADDSSSEEEEEAQEAQEAGDGTVSYASLHYRFGDGEPSEATPIVEIVKLLRDGTIDDETLVWAAGMAEWEPLGDVRPRIAALGGGGGAAAAAAQFEELYYLNEDGEESDAAIDMARYGPPPAAPLPRFS
eukprot:SAG11_NODE_3657_length_2306_cov_1.110104_2_plen_167_part_00